MDAVMFLKEKNRMTNNCKNNACAKCNLSGSRNGYAHCVEFVKEKPELAVAIVETWSRENPAKTYKSVLLERFPSAKVSEDDGVPYGCPMYLFGTRETNCPKNNGRTLSCKECWDREYKES